MISTTEKTSITFTPDMFLNENRISGLFAKIPALLIAKIPAFVIAKKPALLFAVYKSTTQRRKWLIAYNV
jgi:hypothetical protein